MCLRHEMPVEARLSNESRIGVNRQVPTVYRKIKRALKVENLDHVPVGVKLCFVVNTDLDLTDS